MGLCAQRAMSQLGLNSARLSVNITFRRVSWTVNVRNFAVSLRADFLWMLTAGSLVISHDMQLRKCLLVPRSKQGSVRALVLSFAATSVCMGAHLFRNLSTKPSVLKLVRLIMTQHASMAVTWVPHPELILRSAACGYPTPPCHPDSHRGHLSRRLAPFNSLLQPSPMGVQLTMLLHVPVP